MIHQGYIDPESGSILIRLDRRDKARIQVRYTVEQNPVSREWRIDGDLLFLQSWQLMRNDIPDRIELEVFNSAGQSIGVKTLDVYA